MKAITFDTIRIVLINILFFGFTLFHLFYYGNSTSQILCIIFLILCFWSLHFDLNTMLMNKNKKVTLIQYLKKDVF